MLPFHALTWALDTETIRRTFIDNEDNLEGIIKRLPFAGPPSERTKINPEPQSHVDPAALQSLENYLAQDDAKSPPEFQNEEYKRKRTQSMCCPQTFNFDYEPSLQRRFSTHPTMHIDLRDEENTLKRGRSDSFMDRLKEGVAKIFRKGSKDEKEILAGKGGYREVREEADDADSNANLFDIFEPREKEEDYVEKNIEMRRKEDTENISLHTEVKKGRQDQGKSSKATREPSKREVKVLGDRTNQIVTDLV